MNTLVLLMALLGLSYLGGLFGRGAVRRMGLPSVSAWLIVGFLLGPDLLGVIDHAVQADVEPFVHVVLGWVALVVGLDYGVVRSRRLRPGRIALGVFLGLGTVAAIGAAAWWLAPVLAPELAMNDRWALALGLGAVGCESSSNAARWIAQRGGSPGPIAELLDDLGEAKDLAPVLAAGVGLCLGARLELGVPPELVPGVLPSAVVLVGALLGGLAAMTLAREERVDQSWGIVVGIALLAIGTCARLHLPAMAALFAAGLVIGLGSRHRDRLLSLIEPTKRSALLPALVLAGARISPGMVPRYAAFVALVLAVRLLLLVLIGYVLAPRGPARAAAPLLGFAMLPAGVLTVSVGLAFAIACPGFLGECVLLVAVGVTLVGEIIGALSLRAALRRAGELVDGNGHSGEFPL